MPMTDKEVAAMKAEMEALKNANAQLKTTIASMPKPGKLTLKVSEKGGISVIGMGQWPTTLYAEQWKRVLDQKEDILAFIEVNQGKLSTKADKAVAKPKEPSNEDVLNAKLASLPADKRATALGLWTAGKLSEFAALVAQG